MESRFRVRFWATRRPKAEINSQLDLHSIPYQTAPASDKQPVFIHQSLGRSSVERRKSDTQAPLRAFSYRQTKAGAKPVFGGRPQRGNGPVKLQANRILSSGDILETSQDPERTLEEIREGDYIVAGKDRTESSRQSMRSPSATPLNTAGFFLSPHPQGTTTQPAGLSLTYSPLLDIPENGTVEAPISPMTTYSEPAVSRPRSRKQAPPSPNASSEGLGIGDAPALPTGILKTTPKLSFFEGHEEQNPTIRALWKAEYGRLVAMYGQEGVDRNILELKRESRSQFSDPIRVHEDVPPAFTLEPLPRPSIEYRDGSNTFRSSRTSNIETTNHDDTSDESSKRLSFMSSAAYSNYTSGTSVAESDSVTSRADIRRMVDDMRATYIQAMETREPTLQAVRSMKKRKKSRKSTTPAGTPRTSTIRRASAGVATPEKIPQTPTIDVGRISPSPRPNSQRTTRTVSQPVAGIPAPPPSDDIPGLEQDFEAGLKRADSSTLGGLMGESKRSSIKKKRSTRQSARSSTQSKVSAVSSRPATAPSKEPPVLDADLANMYNDIFNSPTLEFWQSSPTIASTVNLPSSFDTSSTIFSTSPHPSSSEKGLFI